MYSEEEYAKRIKEIEPMAKELIISRRPIEARKIASNMSPDDAYILGMHIGGLLQTGFHKHGNDLRGVINKFLNEEDK